MSYRNYLYEIDNDKFGKLRHMSLETIKEKFERDDFIWLPNLVDRQVFEYGTMSDFHKAILKIAKPFFIMEEVQSYFNDNQTIMIVNKEVLLLTIEMMREEVAEMYKKYALDPLMATTFLSHRAADWSASKDREEDYYRGSLPYNLYDDPSASNASHYEYAIFELVRLFKVIDLENKTLVYMGY